MMLSRFTQSSHSHRKRRKAEYLLDLIAFHDQLLLVVRLRRVNHIFNQFHFFW